MSKIHEMSLHQVIRLGENLEVMRVPGGWIYRFFQLNRIIAPGGAWSENQVVDSVFVPFNRE